MVLVTEGCHLCEDACAVVASVCEQTGQVWAARDLAGCDEATQMRWREYVPVVLIAGEVHDIFRVTPDRLRAALT
ncbi:MAG TPA: glutaredoxin family protein [Mycobacteriales bacterium]|nr:glutaredoxin family protein [Mycobacteriales bacterium]